MADCYVTVARAVEHEVQFRRSRFICLLAPAGSEEEARARVAARRTERWSASHNCTAFVLGPDSDTQRSSDDGEPSGAAGVPMLEVLNRRGLTDVVAIVTRYFGGVKLGAGGLIRAYGQAVGAAADRAVLVRWQALRTVTVVADHTLAGRLEHELRTAGRRITDVTYSTDVRFELGVDPDDLDRFTGWVDDVTRGAATWHAGDLRFHRTTTG